MGHAIRIPGGGSIYQRSSDSLWVAARYVDRRKVTATSSSGPQEALNKLRDKLWQAGLAAHELPDQVVIPDSGDPLDLEVALAKANERIAQLLAELAFEKDRRAPVPARLRRAVIARDGSCCRYCGEHLAPDEVHVDHYVPRSLGGTTSYDNLVTACRPCNGRKAARLPHELTEVGLALRPLPLGTV